MTIQSHHSAQYGPVCNERDGEPACSRSTRFA